MASHVDAFDALVRAKRRIDPSLTEAMAIELAAREDPKAYRLARDEETVFLTHRRDVDENATAPATDGYGRIHLEDLKADVQLLAGDEGAGIWGPNADRRGRNAQVIGERQLDDDDPDSILMRRAATKLKQAGKKASDVKALGAAMKSVLDEDPGLRALCGYATE